MELKEKLSVILRCKLAARDEQCQNCRPVSLFQIISALFLPNIIRIGLQLGKLSQK